jgi:hypothetical protein
LAQFSYSLQQGLFYGLVINGYLLLMMMTVNPRIWGYEDYPDIVKQKVQPLTDREKRLRYIFALPFFLFMPLYPIYSVLQMKSLNGGTISFIAAFVHLLILAGIAFLGDLIILDWLIISKITPKFVIIEGSDPADYKDFTHHYIGHAYASVIIILILAALSYIVSVL